MASGDCMGDRGGTLFRSKVDGGIKAIGSRNACVALSPSAPPLGTADGAGLRGCRSSPQMLVAAVVAGWSCRTYYEFEAI